MEKLKKVLDRIFIDGLSGMAQGLFATLIIGTIVQQIGTRSGSESPMASGSASVWRQNLRKASS